MSIVLCSQPGTDKYCKVSIDTSVELQANIEKYTSNRFEKVTQWFSKWACTSVLINGITKLWPLTQVPNIDVKAPK